MIPFMIWNRQSQDDQQPAGSGQDGLRDVSAQADSRKIIAALVRAVPDPFMILDRGGYVISANPAAEELASAELTGQHLSRHFRAPSVLETLEHVIETQQTALVHYERRFGGGRRFEVFVSPFDVELSGLSPAVSVLMRDLTARQQLERMRADFVANASHELRTPLSSMTGYIETLQGPARDDAKAREKFLGRMLDQAHRMRRLIDDLLSLSRIEMNVHRAPADLVDLSEVVTYSAELFAEMASDAGCEIRIEAPPGMVVKGQRDELIQVCQNLLENAIKYGASGKGVEVSVQYNSQRSQIELSVRDFGIGIDKSHLPRLTERFYRVNEQESRSRGGTGLGLAIVKHIVLRHRGQLDIESERGHGSTFKIRLPRAVETAKAAE
jgi:two-component system phosphate regulon sensor histidine kinase PhoR